MKNRCIVICFVTLFCFGRAEAIIPKKNKHTLSVCAIFRNESKNLREWIEYHRLVGVDHFYLYENGSSDRYLKVLRPYINKKIVTIVPWPNKIEKEYGENLFKWVLSTQLTAYENALHMYAKSESKWLVFLDVDEFLVPVAEPSLPKMLEKYEEYPAVMVASEFFDASIQGPAPMQSLVIESTDLTEAPEVNIQERVEKVIFKADQCLSFQWPPYRFAFAGEKKPARVDKETVRINQYLHRNIRLPNGRRKIYLGQRKPKDGEIADILSSGYDIEDQQKAIQRYVPELAKKLSVMP